MSPHDPIENIIPHWIEEIERQIEEFLVWIILHRRYHSKRKPTVRLTKHKLLEISRYSNGKVRNRPGSSEPLNHSQQGCRRCRELLQGQTPEREIQTTLISIKLWWTRLISIIDMVQYSHWFVYFLVTILWLFLIKIYCMGKLVFDIETQMSYKIEWVGNWSDPLVSCMTVRQLQ